MAMPDDNAVGNHELALRAGINLENLVAAVPAIGAQPFFQITRDQRAALIARLETEQQKRPPPSPGAAIQADNAPTP